MKLLSLLILFFLNIAVVKIQYLIKWQGYGIEENTWEPANAIPVQAVVDFETKTIKKPCQKNDERQIAHSRKILRSAAKNSDATSHVSEESINGNEHKQPKEKPANHLVSPIAPRELRSQRHCLEHESRNFETTKVHKQIKSKCKPETATHSASSKKIVRIKPMPVVGDLCFAKVKGFAPWPAVITKIENTGKKIQRTFIWVKFFNSTLR